MSVRTADLRRSWKSRPAGSPAFWRASFQTSQKSVIGCPGFPLQTRWKISGLLKRRSAQPPLDDRLHLALEPERATGPVLRDRSRDAQHPGRAGAVEHVPGQPRDLALAHARPEGPGDEVADALVLDVLQERLDLGPLEEAAPDVVDRERGEVRHEVLREERRRLPRGDVERAAERVDLAVHRGRRLALVEPLAAGSARARRSSRRSPDGGRRRRAGASGASGSSRWRRGAGSPCGRAARRRAGRPSRARPQVRRTARCPLRGAGCGASSSPRPESCRRALGTGGRGRCTGSTSARIPSGGRRGLLRDDPRRHSVSLCPGTRQPSPLAVLPVPSFERHRVEDDTPSDPKREGQLRGVAVEPVARHPEPACRFRDVEVARLLPRRISAAAPPREQSAAPTPRPAPLPGRR